MLVVQSHVDMQGQNRLTPSSLGCGLRYGPEAPLVQEAVHFVLPAKDKAPALCQR